MVRRSIQVALALGSAAQSEKVKAFCQAVEPVAHPQPSKFFAIKTQVLNDGGHSGYPSLDAAAIRSVEL
jgi:hypothetical protein